MNTCSDKITGEHYVSHAALRVLADEKIDVSGFPWLEGGSRIIGFARLTTKCLCAAHNNVLSPLDAVAGRFFAAIKECGTDNVGLNKHFLFSGHDIERWLLKTLAGLDASRSLASNKESLRDSFHESIDVAALLENSALWSRPVGLYLAGRKGQIIQRRDLFHFAPLTRLDDNKLAGITTLLLGFHFTLLAMPPPARAPVEGATYRPSGIIFNYGRVKHLIEISWQDDLEHVKMIIAEDV